MPVFIDRYEAKKEMGEVLVSWIALFNHPNQSHITVIKT